MSDVIVVGGGVIGLMAAWRLAQTGLSVELFEKGKPGVESSSAALGVLSPHATSERPSDFLKLAQASLALYPALAAELREQSGVDVELRDEGMLHVALDDGELEALDEQYHVEQATGVPVKLLSAREARELEPAFGARVRGALHYTATLQVDNVRLCNALALAATHARVKIHAGQMVTRVIRDGHHVSGVQVGSERQHAQWVVIAAGCWSGAIEGISLPVRPAKGQAISLEAPFVISHILDSAAGYIVPRRDGRLLVGATVEDVGFDKRVTVEAVQELLAGVMRVIPALKDANISNLWAGLRPCSADGLPLLGPISDCEGLIAATGHFRNGILLAPITAQLVTAWVAGKQPSVDVQTFSPDRFE